MTELKSIPLELSENVKNVLKLRYLMRDKDNNLIETPDQLFWRVAKNISQADKNYDPDADINATAQTFYEMMARREFLPNSPTLMNAGKERMQQLSGCFVIPIEDDMRSIFEGIKNAALVHQSGGGTGFSFSKLRPAGDIVKSTGGIASGPISFMKAYNAATEAVKQGGTRRGANMGILRVDHPDIKEFITCKHEESSLNNFNISVGLTDKFMKALEEGKKYDLVNPRDGKVVGQLDAGEVFDMIVEGAWTNGEPGIVFIDRMNSGRSSPTPEINEVETTNPCGEQPLYPYESCNLGSVNLSRMLKEEDGKKTIDWDKLRRTVHNAAHFMDNVIDMNRYPLPQIREATLANRRIGLGVMGFSDMLIMLGIPYNSEQGVKAGEEIMRFVSKEADAASAELAKKRGNFPNYNDSIYNNPSTPYMRNATRTTIAPTGSISCIADCSSGIEPLFAISFIKKLQETLGKDLVQTNHLFEEVARKRGFYSEELMKKIAEEGSVAHIKEVPEDVRKVFVTAHDISPEWHIRMQAAFQRWTDNAVSKTVNFPNSATREDIKKAYMLAYQLECKGVTVYRDGSRDVQILVRGKKKKKEKVDGRREMKPRPRPKTVEGMTREIRTGCGDLYITVNQDSIGPFEVFAQMGRSGGCIASYSEAVGRLVSLSLRSGIDPKLVIKQLKGIRCPRPCWENGGVVNSCPDAIAKSIEWCTAGERTTQLKMEEFIKKPDDKAAEALKVESLVKSGARPECPDCGEMVEYVEGCVVCRYCGFSSCG